MDSGTLTASTHACRICLTAAVLFHTDKKREYYKCPQCNFVFVPDAFLLSEEQEKAVYDLHQNTPGDTGYEKFLSRAATPIIDLFSNEERCFAEHPTIHGLDFGCGPSPVLANMLRAANSQFIVDPYDLFYFPENRHCLERLGHYNFVTATEVIEHLQNPLAVLQQLWQCLNPHGGVLLIMTKRVEGSIEKFRNWHYIRDPTHISFFHDDTFVWISRALPGESETCELRICGPDVIMLLKETNRKK